MSSTSPWSRAHGPPKSTPLPRSFRSLELSTAGFVAEVLPEDPPPIYRRRKKKANP